MIANMQERELSSDQLKAAKLAASRADLTPVFRLAYVSKASSLFGVDDLKVIGEQSSQRNSEADITGILVMDGGAILQILEGEKRAVQSLFEKISRDPRHESVRQVAGREKVSRRLSCWSVVSGAGTSAPEGLMADFHALHDRLSQRDEVTDVTSEEVELLKVIALFRSVPL